MEKIYDGTPTDMNPGSAVDPATLGFIERISWFERQKPAGADNDNHTPIAPRQRDSACFDSWALPDYMRK